MNDFDRDFPLGRLLDEAADRYSPVPDAARLQRALSTHHRRRGMVIVCSVAAGLALVGGTALAYRVQQHSARLQPADTPTVSSEHQPRPPFGTGSTSTAPAEPVVTEPTPTVTGEPAGGTETTKPKPSEPKTTLPRTTTTSGSEPPPTEPTVTTPPVVVWSVHQLYGSCNSNPPFDVFYGTATPGLLITIESAWGYAEGTASEAGNWEIHIDFPDAPVGVSFKVGVRYQGVLTKFDFIRLSPV